MTEVTEKKEQPVIKISDKYYVTSDGSRNLILQESYGKRVGRGKTAELSGEEGLRDLAYFGGSISALANSLADKVVMDSFNSVEDGEHILQALEGMKEYIAGFKKDLNTYFEEKVTLQLANVKGNVKEEEKAKTKGKSKK